MSVVRDSLFTAVMGVGLIFTVAPVLAWADTGSGPGPIRPDGGWPPVIGAWFLGKGDLEPGRFKPFLDTVAIHSPYSVLTTACRQIEVVEPGMHDQVGEIVRYANSLGLRCALELDIRVARQAFRAAYPDEQQKELVLKMVEFTKGGFGEVLFQGKATRDHMTGTLTPYECLGTRLVRVYSFRRDADGINPSTVRDITADGVVTTTVGRSKLIVRVPYQEGREACVIAGYEFLTPAVFAPHLLEFQRAIIRQYADIPMAGIMKDEWGFPPDHTGNPAHDRYWYSEPMAAAYAKVSNGRDLVRDTLLMFAGARGRNDARQAAINRYRKLCRTRNVKIENDYYRAAKETFGPAALVVTHPTWIPYPGAQEFRKNGLDWWDATRDIGQTDETTPYPCRTSLAKRWGYPLWYNQFYAKDADAYVGELWAGALSGGRLNVHPLYPRPDLRRDEIHLKLLRSGLMAGLTRLRMLDFTTKAPLECPVAVVFGHACAMNWTQPSYNNVGLGIASALSARGYPTDLIPSSMVASKALKIDAGGYIWLGPQRYRAVVLYQPEFGDQDELDFFSRAASGKSAIFMVGGWTKDFQAQPLDGAAQLCARVRSCADEGNCAEQVARWLHDAGVPPVTKWSLKIRAWGHPGGPLAAPPVSGHTALTDGTYVRVAGATNPAGDLIRETFTWQGHTVTVDAIGVVAIRFAVNGKVAAFAAGGLKSIQTGGLRFVLPTRTDLAFQTGRDGSILGVIHGLAGPVPDALRNITTNWQRLSFTNPKGAIDEP